MLPAGPYILIVDYSAIFHISLNIALHNQTEDFFKSVSRLAFDKIQSIKTVLSRNGINNISDIVMVEDREAVRKKNLLEGYKAGRIDYSGEKIEVKSILRSLQNRWRWCHSPENEADDAMATLSRIARSKNTPTIIVSGDKDMWQLIDQGTRVFEPIKKQFITHENVLKSFDLEPKHIVLYKSFFGDAGDKVPNVMPYQKRHMLPIIRTSDGTMENCHEKIIDSRYSISEKSWSMYEEQQNNVRRNYELVKLDTRCILSWG